MYNVRYKEYLNPKYKGLYKIFTTKKRVNKIGEKGYETR